jgi:Tol biopolymer transport system component
VTRKGKLALGAVLFAASMLLPPAALAVFPGENGKIAFVSGRGGGGDASADVYILSGPNGVSLPLTTAAGQHRLPNWSPNGTKIVYALQNNGTADDIWIHKVSGALPPTNLTKSPTITEDRPTWSPDGTKIAYESEVGTQQDILIRDLKAPLGPNNPLNLTQSTSFFEGQPVWSPNGKKIYYAKGVLDSHEDIFAELANNSQPIPTPIVTSATPEYQPALSPDGTEMCFTRGQFPTSAADIYTVASSGAGLQTDVSDNSGMTGTADYQCAYSPDGTRIAFSAGAFSTAVLVHTASDDSDSPTPLTPDAPMVFDGNADWARVPENCDRKPAGIIGTDNADTLSGFAVNDRIQALAGKDEVRGKAGKDTECGKGGNDKLKGGTGNDKLIGGAGDDVLKGGPGVDKCEGGPGRDQKIGCER